MITPRGWFDWMEHDPGSEARLAYMGGRPTPMTSIFHHSLEGWYQPNGYAAFKDPARFPTLWHWTVKRNGHAYQHAPVMARTVHAHAGNPRGPGGESEGLWNMPLTPEQVATWRRIHADMAQFTGRIYTRDNGGYLEHRQVGPTGCPSERYAPLWASYEEGEDEMTPEERIRLERLERLVGANGYDWVNETGDFVRKTGEAALQQLDADGRSLALQTDRLNLALMEHKRAHPSGGTVPGAYTVSGDLTLTPKEED